MAGKRAAGKSTAAAELARRRWANTSPEERQEFARKAGQASAASLTQAQRKKRAQKAIAARWSKNKAGKP